MISLFIFVHYRLDICRQSWIIVAHWDNLCTFSACCLSVFIRRLEWAGLSSSWWLTWTIWRNDMTETWQSWRRPRRRSSSRTPAGPSLTPEHLQVSWHHPSCLLCLLYVQYLTDRLICCSRSRRQWQQKEELSASMWIFSLLCQLPFHHFNLKLICVLSLLFHQSNSRRRVSISVISSNSHVRRFLQWALPFLSKCCDPETLMCFFVPTGEDNATAEEASQGGRIIRQEVWPLSISELRVQLLCHQHSRWQVS